MLLKVTGKVFLDNNTLYSSIHRVSSYTRLLLLFNVLITVHRVYDYCYCYCTVTVTVSSQCSSNMNIDCLTELNNNLNEQLALGLGKLMEETSSVFWVDLGYRLRSRLRVPL